MASIEEVEPTYTVPEVAQHLRVNPRTVYDELHAGRMRSVRVGPKPMYRIPASALADYIAGRAPVGLVASVGNGN